jgi:hypothetical protein
VPQIIIDLDLGDKLLVDALRQRSRQVHAGDNPEKLFQKTNVT